MTKINTQVNPEKVVADDLNVHCSFSCPRLNSFSRLTWMISMHIQADLKRHFFQSLTRGKWRKKNKRTRRKHVVPRVENEINTQHSMPFPTQKKKRRKKENSEAYKYLKFRRFDISQIVHPAPKD